MPASDFTTDKQQSTNRPKSISPIPYPGHQQQQQQRHRSAARSSFPIPINRSSSAETGSRKSTDLSGKAASTTAGEWSRSIPEAGYITLGTLRYGVRLSNASRFSYGSVSLPCRNSDSIDTCSALLTSPPPSLISSNGGGGGSGIREGRPTQAESPTCGNCCVGLTNGLCCEVSPCFGNVAARNNIQQQRRQLGQMTANTATHQQQQQQQQSAMARKPFPKNRTSTLSPSQTSTRTTSWCSSSSAVSTAVVVSHTTSSTSSRPASSDAYHHRQLSEPFSSCPRSLPGSSKGTCCRAHYRHEGRLKPPVPRACVRPNSRSQCEKSIVASDRETQPRQRSLSTEEEIRTIGCFNLKSSAPIGNKSRVEQLNPGNGQAVQKFDKPSWLQICDPCHRILERSLTPDISDIVLLHEVDKSIDSHRHLDISDLHFIDSSSVGGDFPSQDLAIVAEKRERLQSSASGHKEWLSGIPSTKSASKCVASPKIPTANKPTRETYKNGTAKYPLDSKYLSEGESSTPLGADKFIINNKVIRRHRGNQKQPQCPEDENGNNADDHDDVAAATAAVVANNNLGEKERNFVVESKRLSRNEAVADDRRGRCLNPEVEIGTATQLRRTQETEHYACDNKSNYGLKCCEVSRDDLVESPSFEKDYEKCIESINRQLSSEFGDAAQRRTRTVIGPDQEQEEVTMEKRRNTFERFQRWGFGQRSSSNNDLAAGEPKKKDKSERLKELTELLKSTRIPSLTGFNRNTLRESSCSPPPVPPPRRQRCGLSAEKSFEKLESIEDTELPDSKATIVGRKISVPSMKINEPKSSSFGQSQSSKPLHVSISSPHFRSLLDKSQPPHTTDCNDIPVHAEELFSLPKVEPKTIVGSYAQKNIPYRSASFSQVDFNSGKYSLGSPETKHLKENRNSASLLDSSTYPRRRGDLRLLRNMKLGSPGPTQDQDRVIAEESSPEHEDRRLSVLATIESYEIEESISEDAAVVKPSEESSKSSAVCAPTGANAAGVMASDDDVPTLLSEVTKSETCDARAEDQKVFQTACVIPTPVFECCGKEVDQVTEWFQLRDKEQITSVPVNTKDVPAVAITASADRSPTLSDSPDLCQVEVRKRNTFSSDSGNSKQSSLEKNEDAPSEERRKIDKSKRRKGIYIQWPVSDKSPGGGSWDIDSPECEIGQKGPLKLNVNLGLNFDCLSTASCEPLTPDSDSYTPKPQWPSKSDHDRKKNLTYQSSDEKDEPPKAVPKRTTLLRMDSTSDNESDRATSRDPRSASPSRDDLKRYSKRPLRGPYGQMLEAEMNKKASKLYYDEILDDLRASDLRNSPHAGRSSNSHSLDESAKNANKVPKARKSSAHLPVPFHERAASTPSQMDHQEDEAALSHVQKKFPNSVEKLYFEAKTPERKAPESDRKLKSSFHSEAVLSSATPPPPSTSNNKQCKRTASGFMDRNSRKRAEKADYAEGSLRKHSSEIVETPRGPMASNDLLAELLKGSSEKHHRQNMPPRPKCAAVGHPAPRTLPQAVLKCLDTRTHVVIELFNTEQSYVDSLHTVITKYLNPLKSSDNLRDIVDTKSVDEIFYMVPSILGIHERFLEELHKRLGAWDCNQKVGDAFIDVFSSSSVVEIYVCFVNNWNKAKNAIRQACSAKPAFAKFLETMAREHKGKLSLDNLLIKPVQKFPNYELILSRLIKHTDGDHPDQSLLQEANRLVHNILMQLNCKEREALENGQREATLRELEAVIEGISDLVTANRTFLLFDLVSMFSGQTTRKERGLFLFSDILVIASIKKRTGTIKKPNTTLAGAVAATLDTNKYKFLTKMPLGELEIAKAKDESVRKMMREIEHLSEDNTKIQKIIDIMNSIRFPHQPLEESMRDLQKDVQKQLYERQANDTQLSILEFNLISSDINQNMSILFSKPDKRNQWEEAFSLAKQKLATTSEKNAVPEFLTMIPIRKTRAGLQFTCAASTIGSMNDVWVCNSDGYVGQVCVLSLYPEPTVTSCNGVCNARILCVTSVPPSSYADSSSSLYREPTGGEQLQTSCSRVGEEVRATSGAVADASIQLDSSSSSDNDSDIEFSGQLNSTALGGSLNPISDAPRDNLKEQSPATTVMTNVSSTGSLAKSDAEEMDRTQSTMWLGTEDGCVHVYNCTDNIRIKKNKIKIQHSSAVYSILYLDNRVFVSLANGDICVYLRDNVGWNTSNPITISVGTVTNPVTKLLNVHGKIWCAIQGTIKVLNVQQLQIENHIQISSESKPITNMAASTNCVWVTIRNSSVIKCYHSTGHELLFEIDVSNPVNKMLSTCDDIIRQHKSACLRITSLLACKDLLWIGTSAGVLLNLPVGNSTKGLQQIVSSLTGIPYGHTGHVRFLTSVELNYPSSSSSSTSSSSFVKSTTMGGVGPGSVNVGNKSSATLVISGGDGYEDFRSSSANSANEVAGREDSTNHLLLWQI